MFPGETVGVRPFTKCTGCGTALTLQVCQSGAGYYIGYQCSFCGPYSRESGYFKTFEEAFDELVSGYPEVYARR